MAVYVADNTTINGRNYTTSWDATYVSPTFREEEMRTVPKGDVETYYEDGQWKNKIEGSTRAANVHEIKAAAVGAGRQMAAVRKVEHIIRNMDGTIGARGTATDTTPATSPGKPPTVGVQLTCVRAFSLGVWRSTLFVDVTPASRRAIRRSSARRRGHRRG